MLFFSYLFSFIAAIAFSTGVTAAVTPRWSNPPPSSGQTCSTGSLQCCASISPFSSVDSTVQGGLLGILDPVTNANVPIGLNCLAPGLLGWYSPALLSY